MLDVTSGSGGLGGGAGSAAAGTASAGVFTAFSTRAIEPVMPSRLCSSVATRASSRSRSAASTRTVSASRRPSRASSGRIGLAPDGMRISWISATATCRRSRPIRSCRHRPQRQRGRGGQAPQRRSATGRASRISPWWRQFRAGFRFGQALPRYQPPGPRRRPKSPC